MKYLGIYGTLWITAMALVVSYIAFGSRLMNSAINQIHKELEEAAFVSGATPVKSLFFVTLPLLFPAFAAGWIWVAVHTFRAFAIPLMLSSRKNEVLAVLLWHFWDQAEVPMAASIGVLLIIILIPLTLVLRRFLVKVSEQQV